MRAIEIMISPAESSLISLSLIFPLIKIIGYYSSLGLLLTLSLWFTQGTARNATGFIGLATLYLIPRFVGNTGFMPIDFGLPAFAMLGTLNIADCFYLRSIKEVQSWSFGETLSHLFAFPNERSTSTTPRFDNIKAIGMCSLKYALVNALLYFVPNPAQWATIPTFSLSYFFHSMVVGFCVLFTLASLIESSIRSIGIVCGVEQLPLFDNPNGASNIRLFWSRWNLAIKTGLGRFNGKLASSLSENDKSKSIKYSKDSKIESRSPSTPVGLRSRSNKTTNHPVESESNLTAPSTLSIKRGAFFPKAFAAFVTFLASGLFHEAMNRFVFPDQGFGENLAFFAVNGFATIFYSYLDRYQPQLLKLIPNSIGIALVNIFLILVSPLFVGPFIRSGFFEQFKEFGIFGTVNVFIRVFG